MPEAQLSVPGTTLPPSMPPSSPIPIITAPVATSFASPLPCCSRIVDARFAVRKRGWA